MVSKRYKVCETLNNQRDRDIWDLRLIATDPISLQELSDQYSVSKERIRQLEAR